MEHLDDIGVKAYEKAVPLQRQSTWWRFKLALVNLGKIVKLWVLCLGVFVKKMFTPVKVKNLDNQVVLVTGGANGLGRALCLKFAAEGCHVAVADVDYENAKITAEDLNQFSVKSKAYKCDVSDYNAVVELKQQIENDLGPIDILANNAGILALASLREGKHTDLERIVRVNLLSQIWTTRVFLPEMIRRRQGHILSVCSLTALKPPPRGITYAASKAGVRAMMIALQDELAMDGMDEFVHTTTIYPWFINTRKELIDNIVNKTPSASNLELMTPEYVACKAVEAVKRNVEEIVIPEKIATLFGKGILPREYRKIGQEIFLGDVPKYMDFAA